MVKNDLLAFSQTRWSFVYQRTQHLLSRYADHRRVFFIEEPIFADTTQISYRKIFVENGVEVIKPILNKDFTSTEIALAMKRVVDDLIEDEFIINFSIWYDTPTALEYTRHLSPISSLYDCINESCPETPAELSVLEIELLEKADLVFTANESLYHHRQHQHHNIHSFPNSVDISHFRQARTVVEPLDQRKITGPKLGYYGDINENLNFGLLADMADYRPSWNFILLGPVTGNCAHEIPLRPNIYFFGKKDYKYLPHYFAGWNLTIAPYKFGKNVPANFQIHEFLATGRPIVTTPHDEIDKKYNNLITTADSATRFVAACEQLMQKTELHHDEWLKKVDDYLETKTWDQTFEKIKELEIKTLMSSMPYKRHQFSSESLGLT